MAAIGEALAAIRAGQTDAEILAGMPGLSRAALQMLRAQADDGATVARAPREDEDGGSLGEKIRDAIRADAARPKWRGRAVRWVSTPEKPKAAETWQTRQARESRYERVCRLMREGRTDEEIMRETRIPPDVMRAYRAETANGRAALRGREPDTRALCEAVLAADGDADEPEPDAGTAGDRPAEGPEAETTEAPAEEPAEETTDSPDTRRAETEEDDMSKGNVEVKAAAGRALLPDGTLLPAGLKLEGVTLRLRGTIGKYVITPHGVEIFIRGGEPQTDMEAWIEETACVAGIYERQRDQLRAALGDAEEEGADADDDGDGEA